MGTALLRIRSLGSNAAGIVAAQVVNPRDLNAQGIQTRSMSEINA